MLSKPTPAVVKQHDVVVGRLVSNPSSHLFPASAIIGPCINFVPTHVRFRDVPGGRPQDSVRSIQAQFLKGLPHEHVGLAEIASFFTAWQPEPGPGSDSLSFGLTVQYETYDENPYARVLDELLMLQWHRKPAKALYGGRDREAGRGKLEGVGIE
ncbi:hypothetical protein F5Y15DRAFT_266632 [Neofusicoccum parvum]|nr:hypothetical protein F5Y15DRAFT_266632 [Neofusicoccum parvum]